MGVKGLWRAVADCKHPFRNAEELQLLLRKNFDATASSIKPAFIVDGMVVLLAIWYAQGYGSKTFLMKEDALSMEAAELAKRMVEYLHFVPDIEKATWIFDGECRELSKLRVHKIAKSRAKKLSQATYMYFLSDKHGHQKIAKALWDRHAKPSKAFVQLVLEKLWSSHGQNVHCAVGEADFAISKMVDTKIQAGMRSIVVSSDSDCIAFTSCDAIINPINKYFSCFTN